MIYLRQGHNRMCYIKSFNVIENMAHSVFRNPSEHIKKILILHSSGEGGGLYVSKDFMNLYFGTERLVNVKFARYGNSSREIWWSGNQFDQQIYGEWLTDNRDFSSFLEDELFEL